MKRIRRIVSVVAAVCLAGAVVSCGGTSVGSGSGTVAESTIGGSEYESPEESMNESGAAGEEDTMTVSGMTIPSVGQAADIEKFESEVDLPSGSHDNSAHDEGIVLCPYYTVSVGQTSVPCYSVRTALGLHNFAYIDVTDAKFPFTVTVTAKVNYEKADVLPGYRGSSAKIEGKKISVSIGAFGDSTIVFDEKQEYALTLFVREEENFTPSEGYTVQKIAPGVHDETITFEKEKSVLCFEPGVHYLRHNVSMKNDTVVYVAKGAYIVATMPSVENEKPTQNPDWAGMTRWESLFTADGKTNVALCGAGVIDYSRLGWHARGGMAFDRCDGVTVSGVTLINTTEWTATIIRSENITIDGAILFAYRQNSDGFAIADSGHALVKNCFARSGDDLFEVKSMYSSDSCNVEIKDIVFENCTGWPDKARGMGIIHESVRDMTGIVFRRCSIGFATATWQDQLGALVVILANNARVSDVSFEDIEIFYEKGYPINVTLYEDSEATIDGLSFRNIRIREGQAIRIRNDSSVGRIGTISFSEIERGGETVKSFARLNVSLSGVDRSVVGFAR